MINKNYYNLNFTSDEIRDTYKFNETCQETVPQAIVAFLDSTSFEDAIRTAVSVNGRFKVDSNFAFDIWDETGEFVVMICEPVRLIEFGIKRLNVCKIIELCPFMGSYGRSEPGYFGFKINVNN